MTTDKITITAANLEEIREQMPRDQANELVAGCETWGVYYSGSCRGQMTVWPNGRGAVEFGGDSIWGDWVAGDRLLFTEDHDADGNTVAYTDDGEAVAIGSDGARLEVAR